MNSLNNNTEANLIKLAASGDTHSIEQLIILHRDRLKRMIVARMDERLARRMETSDVVQEVQLEVSRRLPEYLANPEVPFFVWVRFLARQKLAELIRRHVLTQARDVRREQSLSHYSDSSTALSQYLCGQIESPSSKMRKEELRELLIKTIETMPETDREILLLKHVEQLTTSEAAVELEITENTCRQRHLRALKKLKDLLNKNGLSWGENS